MHLSLNPQSIKWEFLWIYDLRIALHLLHVYLLIANALGNYICILSYILNTLCYAGYFSRGKNSSICSIICWMWNINSMPTDYCNSTGVLQVSTYLCTYVQFHIYTYRNTLFKGTHNFIHLNLALALLFALITFVSGIGTATESEVGYMYVCNHLYFVLYIIQIGCTIVAALLHYFFTAVFTWMLCEGIMMYFLLVKIFRIDFGKKKLPYLALGWGN